MIGKLKFNFVIFLSLSIVFLILFSLITIENNRMKNSDAVEYVIGMSQANLYEPWRISMNEEIVNEAKKYKNIRIIYKDAGGDTNKQKKDIDELLDSGVDLLIVSINDSEKLTPEVSKAYKAVPVVVLDRAVEGYNYSVYIGPDNENIGKEAGRMVVDLMENNEGRVVEVQGLLNSHPDIDRSKGFREAIKQYSNIKIVRTVIGEWQKDEAEDKITEVLKEDKNIDVIFAHSDYMALGAYKAAYKLGIHNIKIIGVDGLTGENGGLDLVSRGILDGTFTCSTGGKEALECALNILNKKNKIQKKIILKSDKITKNNVNEYLNNKFKYLRDNSKSQKIISIP